MLPGTLWMDHVDMVRTVIICMTTHQLVYAGTSKKVTVGSEITAGERFGCWTFWQDMGICSRSLFDVRSQTPIWRSIFLFFFLRYVHVPPLDAAENRRGSAPAVLSPASGERRVPTRRGSEPSVMASQRPSGHGRRGSEPLVTRTTTLERSFERLTTRIAEEDDGYSEMSPPHNNPGTLDLKLELEDVGVCDCDFTVWLRSI